MLCRKVLIRAIAAAIAIRILLSMVNGLRKSQPLTLAPSWPPLVPYLISMAATTIVDTKIIKLKSINKDSFFWGFLKYGRFKRPDV